MKTLKITLIILISSFVITGLFSCNKCRNEDPSARIINDGTKDASVQVKTSGGNTININNVAPGTSSDYRTYAPGTVTYTITIADINYVETVEMVECYNYDIVIDSNNNIETVAYYLND